MDLGSKVDFFSEYVSAVEAFLQTNPPPRKPGVVETIQAFARQGRAGISDLVLQTKVHESAYIGFVSSSRSSGVIELLFREGYTFDEVVQALIDSGRYEDKPGQRKVQALIHAYNQVANPNYQHLLLEHMSLERDSY
jgi:hypothetical protein